MSVDIVNKAWGIQGVSPIEKLTLVLLADESDRKGKVQPTPIKKLSAVVGCSPRSMSRTIRSLEKKGFLIVVHSNRSDGGTSANGFELLPS